MLRFVSEPLQTETAVLYTQGRDVLVILNSNCTDPQARCDTVNRLLARLLAARGSLAA